MNEPTVTHEKWEILPGIAVTTLEDHEANERSFDLDELVVDHGDGGGHPTIGFVDPEFSERIARLPELERALRAFVDCIEATGGCTFDTPEDSGLLVPVADPEWIDLASAYLQAARALKREAVIHRPDEP